MPIAVFIKWKLFHTHGQKEMLVLVISGFLIEKLDDKAQQVQVLPSLVTDCKKPLHQNQYVLGVRDRLFLSPTQIKKQVSRDPEKIWHFYCGENRVKISLLFLTLETVDFESEHFFESHGQLQSAADLMPALTRF